MRTFLIVLMFLIAAVLLFFGIVLFIAIRYHRRDYCEKADAEILGAHRDPQSGNWFADYAFHYMGNRYTGQEPFGVKMPDYALGQSIEVIFSPRAPEKSEALRLTSPRRFLAGALVLLGLLFAAGAVLILLLT